MMRIYADNAATTTMSPRALRAYTDAVSYAGGNPSSIHSAGFAAKAALESARERIAACLGCCHDDVYFTSGGSEADTQALLSAAMHGKKNGKTRIITTAFEHHAVLNTAERLKAYGFEITYIGVGPDGIVDPAEIDAAIDADTALVSVMLANNEIGTVQPIDEIGKLCRRHGVLFHTDAVQAVGHIKINAEELGVDFLSLSAHKFHGPRGVGAVIARNGAPVLPLIIGGGQERGRRAGTENVPGIVSMAEALEESLESLDEKSARTKSLRDRIISGILKIPGSVLNGDRSRRLPGNVNVSFEGVDGEPLVLMLDTMGIEASTGSACTAGALEPSHVLLAIGRSAAEARGALRLSIDESMTETEADTVISSVAEAVSRIRELS